MPTVKSVNGEQLGAALLKLFQDVHTNPDAEEFAKVKAIIGEEEPEDVNDPRVAQATAEIGRLIFDRLATYYVGPT